MSSASTIEKPKGNAWIPDFGAKGWGLVVICFFFCFFFSFWTAATNTLYGYYGELYGWQMDSMAFIITLGGWLSLITTYLFSLASRKIGPKAVTTIGLAGCAASFVILAVNSGSFEMFAAGVLLFYLFSCGFMPIGLGELGSSWFPRKKGSFMGIVTIGMTLCTATVNPLIVMFRDGGLGVSGFFWTLAIILALLAALTWIFVKNTPEEAGCYPDNDKSFSREELEKEAAAAAEYKKHSPWTTAKVLKTPQTWLIALSGGFPMLVGGGFLTMVIPVTMAFGHDEMFGILLMGTMWPIGMIGHYLVGVFDAKFGTKKTAIMVTSVLALGALLMSFGAASDLWASIAMGCFFFGISGAANVSMSLTTSIFGRYDFPVAWAPIQILTNCLGFSGTFVFAWLMVTFGATGLMPAACVLCLIGIGFMFLLPYKQIGSQIHGDEETAVTEAPAAE